MSDKAQEFANLGAIFQKAHDMLEGDPDGQKVVQDAARMIFTVEWQERHDEWVKEQEATR